MAACGDDVHRTCSQVLPLELLRPANLHARRQATQRRAASCPLPVRQGPPILPANAPAHTTLSVLPTDITPALRRRGMGVRGSSLARGPLVALWADGRRRGRWCDQRRLARAGCRVWRHEYRTRAAGGASRARGAVPYLAVGEVSGYQNPVSVRDTPRQLVRPRSRRAQDWSSYACAHTGTILLRWTSLTTDETDGCCEGDP